MSDTTQQPAQDDDGPDADDFAGEPVEPEHDLDPDTFATEPDDISEIVENGGDEDE